MTTRKRKLAIPRGSEKGNRILALEMALVERTAELNAAWLNQIATDTAEDIEREAENV